LYFYDNFQIYGTAPVNDKRKANKYYYIIIILLYIYTPYHCALERYWNKILDVTTAQSPTSILHNTYELFLITPHTHFANTFTRWKIV